jgi:Amt family ammonium transporter
MRPNAAAKCVGALMPLKATDNEEGLGMDISQHGEEAYGSGEGAILILPDHGSPAASALIARPGSGHP